LSGKAEIDPEAKVRSQLITVKEYAKSKSIPWHVVRTIVVLKDVPVVRVHRYWFLDEPALTALDREVVDYKARSAALVGAR
jgi:hypothetical protein